MRSSDSGGMATRRWRLLEDIGRGAVRRLDSRTRSGPEGPRASGAPSRRPWRWPTGRGAFVARVAGRGAGSSGATPRRAGGSARLEIGDLSERAAGPAGSPRARRRGAPEDLLRVLGAAHAHGAVDAPIDSSGCSRRTPRPFRWTDVVLDQLRASRAGSWPWRDPSTVKLDCGVPGRLRPRSLAAGSGRPRRPTCSSRSGWAVGSRERRVGGASIRACSARP